MATYKKPLYTAEVITTCGETYTVSDTAEKALASPVIAQFDGEKTLILETGENEKTYIPFHAVCVLKVTVSTEDVEKADPYGCEEEAQEEPTNGEG